MNTTAGLGLSLDSEPAPMSLRNRTCEIAQDRLEPNPLSECEEEGLS